MKNIRVYELQFKEMIEAVFQAQAYFKDFFGGDIEALEGVSNNETAFYVKTTDIPMVVQEYSTEPNVAFGTGTGSTNRFGERQEVVYATTPVPYTWEWALHKGIDRQNVNIDLEEAVADVLAHEAEYKMAQFNKHHGAFISASADETKNLDTFDAEGILALFNELSAYFTNTQVFGDKVASVTPQVYNLIVDHPLATTEKKSSADIDNNEILKFKGFEIVEVPEALFEDGEVVYAYVKNVAKAFTGINSTRTIESEDFDGVAVQGAGKAGEYIPEANKKAVVKVVGTPAA